MQNPYNIFWRSNLCFYPAGHKYIDVLKDSDKLSLQIAIDIVIGETSMLADYIISESFHYNFLF
jgi:hypothetical protein